jgi:hypothetical protein
VVRLGGSVAILFWSSQMLLPGHPVLEARLNATRVGIAPYVLPVLRPGRGVVRPSAMWRGGWWKEASAQNSRQSELEGVMRLNWP